MVWYIGLAILIIILLFKNINRDFSNKDNEYTIDSNDAIKDDDYLIYSEDSIKLKDINNELDKDKIEQIDKLIKHESCNEETYESDKIKSYNLIIEELFDDTIVRKNIKKNGNTNESETLDNEIEKINYEYNFNIRKDDPIVELINEYILFEDTYVESYDNVLNYYKTLIWEIDKKNIEENYIPYPRLVLITWDYFSDNSKQSIEDLIYRIEKEMINRESYKLIIDIDVHGATLFELEELLKLLMNCLEKYFVKLTLIHGYTRGTVLKDYISTYSHPSIKIKEYPIGNMGRTVYNIGDRTFTGIYNGYQGNKKTDVDIKLNKIIEEEKAALERNEVEKRFIEFYPNLYNKKLELEEKLGFYGLSRNSIKMFSFLKDKFERIYNRKYGKNARIEINREPNLNNEDSIDIPDYVDAMFYDFYFSENIESLIYAADNKEMENKIYIAYCKIESYITTKIENYVTNIREERLRIQKMFRNKEIEVYKENYEIEKADRYAQLENLVDNFHNIKTGSIIDHSIRGVLKVVKITDTQIITIDEDNTERSFIRDPKILKHIFNIKF